MHLGISENGGVSASIKIKATFIEEIMPTPFEDENLKKIMEKMENGKAYMPLLFWMVYQGLNGELMFLKLMTWFKYCWQNLMFVIFYSSGLDQVA